MAKTDFTAEELAKRQAAMNKPYVGSIIKYMARSQVAVFKASGGRLGSKWRVGAGWKKPVPVFLLDHVGRKSGKVFTTPLLYLSEGDDYVIVASQGGLPKNPQWYYNLKAHPEVSIQVRGVGRRAVRAEEADETQRANLWPKLVELYDDFDTYQATTDRTIPVMILKPR